MAMRMSLTLSASSLVMMSFYVVVVMVVLMMMVSDENGWVSGVEGSRGVEMRPYGRTSDGRQVVLVALRRGRVRLALTNWGATITSLLLPNAQGELDDVVLGYDSLKGYQNGSAYFGAIVGRVANRIAGGTFVLDRVRYNLTKNEGNNTLHGGKVGYDKVLWEVSSKLDIDGSPSATFKYRSFDGEQGFPGTVNVSVKYKLTKHRELVVDMKGVVGIKPTPVNLAQHAYWNLGGHDSGTILKNKLEIFGDQVTTVDENLIPNGKLKDVRGTPYDFTTERSIWSQFKNVKGGYDINYALKGGKVIKVEQMDLHLAARVSEPMSGRILELYTNQPGMQFYTGNHLDRIRGKNGTLYQAHSGLCLETQGYPNAINQPNFPSILVEPGQVYHHRMLFRFSVQK